MDELRAAAGMVCAALADAGFRDVVGQAGASDTLERVVAALGTEGPLVPAGLAGDLAQLNHQLTVFGLDGLNEAQRHYRPLPGAQGHPVVEVFRCPQDRCARIAAGPEAAADPPRCAATGRTLRATRLPT